MKLLAQHFFATGYDQLDERAIERIVELEGGLVDHAGLWPDGMMVILGSEDFDEDYLVKSINIALAYGSKFQYISHWDFFDYWLDGTLPRYYKGDPRIDRHPALSFLASIGFEWPVIEVSSGQGESTEGLTLNEVSELRLRYKYRVYKGLSEKTRRTRLGRAVTESNGLGLAAVANHIAFLIRLNSAKNDEMLVEAIYKWNSDLDLTSSPKRGAAIMRVFP
jgi:hypothetical protein